MHDICVLRYVEKNNADGPNELGSSIQKDSMNPAKKGRTQQYVMHVHDCFVPVLVQKGVVRLVLQAL